MCPNGGATCGRWTRNQDNVSEWRSDMLFAGLGIRTMCPSGGATCISLDSESGQCVPVEERHAFRRLVSVIQHYKNLTDRLLTTITHSFTECLVLGLWCLTPLSNISVILWRSVLLVEETGVSGVNHRPVVSH